MPGWAVVSAALAPVALIGGWSLARLRQPPGYDPARDSISALAAHGAADRWIMTAGLAVLGACHVVTASGLREAAVPGRALLALGGVATLVVAVLAQPAAGHIPAAATAFVALALWPAAALVPRRRTGYLASATLLGLLGWLVVELHRSDLLGLTERVLAAAEAGWPLVVALTLAGSRGRRSSQN